jgi:hypothetical protein
MSGRDVAEGGAEGGTVPPSLRCRVRSVADGFGTEDRRAKSPFPSRSSGDSHVILPRIGKRSGAALKQGDGGVVA